VADRRELPLKYRLFLARYRWRVIDPSPWVPLRIPLSAARIALATSAGLYRAGVDQPFLRTRGGDPSVRWIDATTPLAEHAVGQTSAAFDREPILADRNEGFPLDRLKELVERGRLGSVAARHPSFNGSLTAPSRFVRDTAPAVAEILRQDRVDAALLVPV
jgi:hypothetical protein